MDWCFKIKGNYSYLKSILYKELDSIKNPLEKNIKEICEKEKNVFEQVDKIICLSNSTQNLLSKIYDLPINKFCILYNGLKDESILLNSDKRLNLKKNFLFSKEEKIILNMHNNGFTVEQIAMATDKNVEEVKAIIAGKEPALA